MNKIDIIKKRSELYSIIRDFFAHYNYLEIETPILSKEIIPETSINHFHTKYRPSQNEQTKLYLLPSPEYWMKLLISNEINNSIFQICKCFRNGEEISSHHNIEFSMLEWYTLNIDYYQNIDITKQLIEKIYLQFEIKIPDWKIMTMEQLFIKYAGFSLESNFETENLIARANDLELNVSKKDTWDDIFHLIFIDKIEARLQEIEALFIIDWPYKVKTLAKRKNKFWSERWELYLNGIELANCYSEENDIKKIENYWYECANKTNSYFINLMKTCGISNSGVALGLDRLLMILTNIKSIEGVILFPFRDTIIGN